MSCLVLARVCQPHRVTERTLADPESCESSIRRAAWVLLARDGKKHEGTKARRSSNTSRPPAETQTNGDSYEFIQIKTLLSLSRRRDACVCVLETNATVRAFAFDLMSAGYPQANNENAVGGRRSRGVEAQSCKGALTTYDVNPPW